MPHGKNKRKSVVDDESAPKKSSSGTACSSIVPSKVIGQGVEKLKSVWLNQENYSDELLSLCSTPFQHGECKSFVDNEEFLEELLEKMDTFEFHLKESDLFQFRQSDDLKSFVDPHIYILMEYLTNSILPWLKDVTGLPLNGSIDLFLSDYRKNDFLLCHDDELDSRRIAFILYLNKTWKAEFGGKLDLFSATKDIHPISVVKSITPEFNKFVFFSVGATSFHQVSEVTEEGVKRLALSGWFYGDPVPRPKIEFPKDHGYLLNDIMTSHPEIITQFCSESYSDESTLQDINEQVSEESQVLIPGFLQDDVYKAICIDMVDQDATFGKFVQVGPPNMACYQEMDKGPPVLLSAELGQAALSKNVQGLRQLFHSKEFFHLVEKVTELPFTSSQLLRGTSSIRKYAKGSYSLLTSGGAKQTGDVKEKDDVTQNTDSAAESNDVGDSADDENESDEGPNLVDFIYFVSSKWNENWGGLTIYNTDDGDHLLTVSPEGNCLAIVVRNSSVNSCVNYVNCDAGEEVYFAFTMTCALDGNL